MSDRLSIAVDLLCSWLATRASTYGLPPTRHGVVQSYAIRALMSFQGLEGGLLSEEEARAALVVGAAQGRLLVEETGVRIQNP